MFPVFCIVLIQLNLLCHATFIGEELESYSLPPNANLGKYLGELTIYHEISNFLTDGREKLETDCTIVIWDYGFSTVLDHMRMCGDPGVRQGCIPIYTVLYDEVINNTEGMVRTLREGYRRQCGSYIIILKSAATVVELLHQGDYYRLMNIRARFLIWYGIIDKTFEFDDIWKKVPNAILFHTKLGFRARKRMTFTIKGFKWPVLPNATEPLKVIDFWSQGKYFGRSHDSWYRDKTVDLKNSTLRILAVEHPPGVIKYDSDGVVEYAGNEVEIVRELSSIMNFQYEFVEVDSESKWGGQSSSNFTPQFYGAVAKLIYGDADLAIGSFFVLKHYLDFLDMSIPLDVACTSFLTPNPLTRPRYLALILPFNYKLWALVLSICFIFAPFGLYALSKLPMHRKEYQVFKARSQVVFTCFSIMSQVALYVWPKFWAIRMFIGWFWMFCLLITLCYRGAMVSFLTIPLFENSIDNINDLVVSNLRIGGWGTELHRLFTQYTDTNGHVAEKSILRDRYEVVDDVDEAVSWVADGEFALYENIRFLKFIRQTRNLTRVGSPSMRIMKQCILPVHIGIAYQKNSPIVPTINRHIRRFQESGLMKRWSQRLVARTKLHYQQLAEENPNAASDHSHDSENDDNEEEQEDDADASTHSNNKQRKMRVLNMRDLQGSIYLIILGFFLSIMAFVAEIFYANSKDTTQLKKLNTELKKIKDRAKDKRLTVGVSEIGNKLKGTIAMANKKSIFMKKQPRKMNMLRNKQQLLANMLMEYEGFMRMNDIEALTKKTRRISFRKPKPDSVRVKLRGNREEYFTYIQ